MKPYIKPKTGIERAMYNYCPECGGDTTIDKRRILASGTRMVQLKCRECGKYHTINEKKLNKVIK